DSDDAAMTYERFIRCGSAKPVANYYEAVRPSPAHRYFRPRGWSRLRLDIAGQVLTFHTSRPPALPTRSE
ncbi:MAG: hypothetical protein WBZ51_23190, partial [Xanthobacteraceae bacterium]